MTYRYIYRFQRREVGCLRSRCVRISVYFCPGSRNTHTHTRRTCWIICIPIHRSWYNWPCGECSFYPTRTACAGSIGIRDLFLDCLKNNHMGTPENLLYEIPPDPHPARSAPSFPLQPHNEVRQFYI